MSCGVEDGLAGLPALARSGVTPRTEHTGY